MKMTVTPRAFSRAITSPSQSTSPPESDEVGSSSSRMLRLAIKGAGDLDLLLDGEIERGRPHPAGRYALEAEIGEMLGHGLLGRCGASTRPSRLAGA